MTETGRVRLTEDQFRATWMLQVFGANGVPARIEAVVDTGFSGEIALPERLVGQLGLKRLGTKEIRVADGRLIDAWYHELEIEWQDGFRHVEVISTETFPLIGMALLRGSRLCVMVEDAGEVEITPIDQLKA